MLKPIKKLVFFRTRLCRYPWRAKKFQWTPSMLTLPSAMGTNAFAESRQDLNKSTSVSPLFPFTFWPSSLTFQLLLQTMFTLKFLSNLQMLNWSHNNYFNFFLSSYKNSSQFHTHYENLKNLNSLLRDHPSSLHRNSLQNDNFQKINGESCARVLKKMLEFLVGLTNLS